MDDQNRNLILAMVLSSLVLIIWMVLFAPPPTTETGELAGAETTEVTNVPAPTQDVADGSPEETVAATPEAERIEISTPRIAPSMDGLYSGNHGSENFPSYTAVSASTKRFNLSGSLNTLQYPYT